MADRRIPSPSNPKRFNNGNIENKGQGLGRVIRKEGEKLVEGGVRGSKYHWAGRGVINFESTFELIDVLSGC